MTVEAEPPPRIATLDILRGLALLGMLLVHFHQKFRTVMPGVDRYIGERWADWTARVWIKGNAWGSFAILLGVGCAVLMRLAYRKKWLARLAFIGRAGRLSLANYVLQALIIEYLANRFDFGFQLRPYHYVVGALILFTAQILMATLWFSRFSFGPLEWLWRSFTYKRVERSQSPLPKHPP